MNWAHIHLLLNHIPVLGTAFGILLLAFAIVRKSEEIKQVSLGVFVFTAVAALPADFTGERAAEMVENLPGVSKPIIEPHEKSAVIAMWAAEILGIVALGGLLRFRRSRHLPHWFVAATLILAIAAGGLMARTANLGGKIRHTEIRDEI